MLCSQLKSRSKVCYVLRRFVHQQNREEVWKLSNHKFFLPIQSRWTDTDSNGHINNSIYIAWAGVMLHKYTLRHFNMENTHMVTVHADISYRKPLIYPEISLGGLSVSKIGNSAVTFNAAFFKPKSPNGVNPLASGLTFSGKFWNEVKLPALTSFYDDEAAAVADLATVYINKDTLKSVRSLPNSFKEGLEKVLLT